jgi:addiction module HigA family antidote
MLSTSILSSTIEEGATMAVYKAVRNKNRCPSHPGAVIADILTDIDKPKTAIAGLLGISRQQLYDILTEKKPVSAPIAVRIAKLFGGSAESWLHMQAAYDAWHAERTTDVSDIKPLSARVV